MKMQNVPLDQIVSNPWRDKDLYPVSDDQVKRLKGSIKDHGFFASLKGRRRNGKVELGCGHARFEAAEKAGLDTIPIYIDDLDDDAMLRLMTDENATQSGSNPGAVMNEVAAVTRRLIEGLLVSGTIVPPVRAAFENNAGIKQACTRLRAGKDVHLALGHYAIRRYLGQGNPDRSHRAERQLREAISALKQSGRYDDIVEEMVTKFPPPTDAPPAKTTTIAKIKEHKPRHPRILDERCANVFPNDHQFHAFREAVTTAGAQRVIPVENQLALAKSIMKDPEEKKSFEPWKGATNKKQIGAPYIKGMVQAAVEDGLKEQRKINKEEREAYLNEQREARIEDELHSANASLRSLISALLRLEKLADQFPAHPKLGGFSARLDDLVSMIKQFSRKLK